MMLHKEKGAFWLPFLRGVGLIAATAAAVAAPEQAQDDDGDDDESMNLEQLVDQYETDDVHCFVAYVMVLCSTSFINHTLTLSSLNQISFFL